jgi:hypothetical protein
MIARFRMTKTWLRTKGLTSAHRGDEILFFPGFPLPFNYTMAHICARLGLRMKKQRSERTKLAIYWKDASVLSPPQQPTGLRCVNAHCLDITKAHVAKTFEDIFGYSHTVDPAKPQGLIVRKSNLNGMHDGILIETPASPEPGYVYETVIDNQINDGFIEDIRVPIIGSQIPCIYFKRRWIETRFGEDNSSAALAKWEDALSKTEVQQLMTFAKAMGAEFCELDVLRDRKSGLIYVVDVNKTPWGPPKKFSFREKIACIDSLALAFQQEFLS